jgi:hypothetical protein
MILYLLSCSVYGHVINLITTYSRYVSSILMEKHNGPYLHHTNGPYYTLL